MERTPASRRRFKHEGVIYLITRGSLRTTIQVFTEATDHVGAITQLSLPHAVVEWMADLQAPAETSLPESVKALQGWLRRFAAEVNDYGTEGNEDLYDALDRGADQLDFVLGVLDQYMSDSVKDVDAMLKPPRYSVGELHGTPVVWEMNELIDGTPDPRPLSLFTIAKMLNER